MPKLNLYSQVYTQNLLYFFSLTYSIFEHKPEYEFLICQITEHKYYNLQILTYFRFWN